MFPSYLAQEVATGVESEVFLSYLEKVEDHPGAREGGHPVGGEGRLELVADAAVE